MFDKMTGFRKEQKLRQKGENEGTEEVEIKTYDNCVVFYAKEYPQEQQEAIKAMREIGYDEDWNPIDKPINILRSKFKNKKALGNAMKFSAFINDQVLEKRSLSPLDLEMPYNEKEIIEQNMEFIFGEIKIKNIDFKEKNEG